MAIGNFAAGATVTTSFNTADPTQAPITLAGTPAVKVYKDSGTTESTAGVTLTVDYDGRTGFHLVAIDTSADGTFYAAGSEFQVVLTAGTVNGISVAGRQLEQFGIVNRADEAGVTTLLSRLTATRAGYLDNLSAGAVALQSSLSALITTVGAAGAGLTATATAVWAVATRLLTAGTNIVLAKGTGVTGFTDISAAAVNAEVVDALNVDTYAEPGQEAPGATVSLVTKISYLYKAFRNKKTQTSTTMNLFADDGTTVDQKATVSDNGTTYTGGEIASGP